MLNNPLQNAIKKVATGPEYSKDLSYDEALESMTYILGGHADPVQTGIYFIALRMKRETSEENRGIYGIKCGGGLVRSITDPKWRRCIKSGGVGICERFSEFLLKTIGAKKTKL